ncbi:MAG TPA: hypothetical protein VEU96_29715 [Bryobacteraceae bacterium]|nr:hypothetical protein [Bryobacteraceae bacterium]
MKPAPAPNIPGTTEWERFDNAVSRLFSAPKAAFLKQDAKARAKNRRKRLRAKKTA